MGLIAGDGVEGATEQGPSQELGDLLGRPNHAKLIGCLRSRCVTFVEVGGGLCGERLSYARSVRGRGVSQCEGELRRTA
jgi:hypothetical protein